jgi:hypothetical protein
VQLGVRLVPASVDFLGCLTFGSMDRFAALSLFMMMIVRLINSYFQQGNL